MRSNVGVGESVKTRDLWLVQMFAGAAFAALGPILSNKCLKMWGVNTAPGILFFALQGRR